MTTKIVVCRTCGVELRFGENANPNAPRNHICYPCQREEARIYRNRPDVKEKRRLYLHRPDVKARVRKYEREYAKIYDINAYGRLYRHRPEVKAKMKLYRERPEIKARLKAYRSTPEYGAKVRAYAKRPEVKERMRQYAQRPEVKARKAQLNHEKWLALSPEEKKKMFAPLAKRSREYQRYPHTPIIDCFDKSVAKTEKELMDLSGAGVSYLRARLKEYVAIGLVKALGNKTYCLNSESSLRMAADGYFKEASDTFSVARAMRGVEKK